MRYDIRVKRVYEPVSEDDGTRVLVDRVWPRGKRREALALAEWYRNASPSPKLRKRWHAGNLDYEQFAEAYSRELATDPEALVPLMRHARQGRLTLLTAVRDVERSHMPVLKRSLEQALRDEDWQADRDCGASPPCHGQ